MQGSGLDRSAPVYLLHPKMRRQLQLKQTRKCDCNKLKILGQKAKILERLHANEMLSLLIKQYHMSQSFITVHRTSSLCKWKRYLNKKKTTSVEKKLLFVELLSYAADSGSVNLVQKMSVSKLLLFRYIMI